MNKINVLHITPLLTVGGAEKKLVYIISKLDKEVFSQHVIYSIPGALKEEVEKEEVPLVRIHPMSLRSPLSLITLWRIYQYIRKNKIDLVHCHLDIAYVLGSIASLMARVPVIFSFQNIGDEKVFSFYRIFKHLEKIASSFTEKILVESEEVRKVLVSWGIKKEKLEVIPNGVDIPDNPEIFNEKGKLIRNRLNLRDCFVVGNMARLVDFKNHRLLIEAAARVVNVKPDTTFLIIGDGPLREELETLSRNLGIADHVLFPGTVLDFEPYLAALDLFVLSSLTESTPMSLLHALAYGRPVISTAVGDIPSIISNGVNGILVPSNEVDALSGAILDLIDNEERRKRLADAGRELAEREFSIKGMIEKIARVYMGHKKGQTFKNHLW